MRRRIATGLIIIAVCMACLAQAQTAGMARMRGLIDLGGGKLREITIEMPWSATNVLAVGGGSVIDIPANVMFGTSNKPLRGMYLGLSGIESKGRGVFTQADIETTDPDRGLILTDTNGVKWLIWPTTAGEILTTQVAASPEVAWTTRVDRLERRRRRIRKTRRNWTATNTVVIRLRQVERILGLRQLDPE